LFATIVVLSKAPLSSIHDFLQQSASVTDRQSNHATTYISSNVNENDIYRPTTGLSTAASDTVKKKPKQPATNVSPDAKRLGIYRPPVIKYKKLKDLPLPLQVIEQYKKWHSVDALLRNDTVGRKYAVAFYQCPLQAGNRMHHFFNDFLWAVLTNRTMLWKYYDRKTCNKYGKEYGPKVCQLSNTVDVCNGILVRAPWIPSFDEWAPKLDLEEPFEFPFRSTHPKAFVSNHFPWKHGDEKLHGADDGKKYPQQVAVFVQNVWKSGLLEQESIRNELLGTSRARERAKQLYAWGTDFLFGMLHRSAFDFSDSIRASSNELLLLDNTNVASVAVHSRHIYENVDGCTIDREIKCLQTILRHARGRSVNVRLMSDRECTISRLTRWLNKQNISVAVAKHDESKGSRAEHGPFAGAGYYQDLALASTARSAIVAMKRSSSDLMLELVVFHRKMDAWKEGKNVTASNVEVCYMDYQYNATPSTKQQSVDLVQVASVKEKLKRTATSDSLNAKRLGVFRPPLPKYASIEKLPLPLQIVEQYKRWHSVDNLLCNDTVGRKYAMAFYRCPMEAGNRMHHFFNDFFWAILTNRTILWKYYDRETCLKYGRHYSKGTCLTANTVDDCAEILLRAPWIPSYDEWAPKLNLAEPFEFPFHSTHPKSIYDANFPWNDGDEKLYGADDEKKYPHQVAAFAQNRFKFFSLEDESVRNEMLATSRARECAAHLYSLRSNFLFGMLHRSAFDFSKPIRASAGTLDNKNAVSVAVHSRHIYDEVDGCNIARETKCMETIIRNARGKRINVGLMSDRECTITRLTTWLHNRSISVKVAKHDADTGPHAEHGPFAGVGFFQDLALVSTARSAIVAMERSSSNLMRELINFHRKLDAWIAGEDVEAANVENCMMDYNYNVTPNSIEQSTGRITVASVKERPNKSSTNDSPDANRLGVYRPPLPKYASLDELPLPLQVVEQYKQWHSVDVLARNDTVGRKYAIAFYRCPQVAGNRMHQFFNDFLWAILTNRTMLWKYWDQESCLKYGRHYSKGICLAANAVDDCTEILLRAPWIPAYDEWAQKLNLAEPYEFAFHSTHPKSIVNEKFPWNDGDEKLYGADDEKKYPHQIAVFSQNRFKFRLLEFESVRNDMLGTSRARECAKSLYALGTDFLFGMLHRSAFDFSKPIRASAGTLDNKNAVSVAVHSRHIYDKVDGCNIARETSCIQKIIRHSRGRKVNVGLMSDRECTISRLTTWLHKRNISVAVAKHDAHNGPRAEHGPFAGAGYYQDLALASTARSAIVAMKRSSSDLMLELVVFHRKMDAWIAGNDVMAANVEVCIMDYKYNATPSSDVVQ
jgi:hypothetical protein